LVKPTHADFSTYHSLWFIHDLAESPLLQGHPRLLNWMARMKAFGHGQAQQINEAQALQAAQAQPRAIAQEYRQDVLIGQTVTIALPIMVANPQRVFGGCNAESLDYCPTRR
jgi:hypothetical protein